MPELFEELNEIFYDQPGGVDAIQDTYIFFLYCEKMAFGLKHF
jgi:hypothetical protein